MLARREEDGSTYRLLEDGSSQDEYKEQQSTLNEHREETNQDRIRPLLWQSVTAVSIIALAVVLSLYLQLLYSVHKPKLECGSTIEQAVSRGCTWDPLTKYWLPAECPRNPNLEDVDRNDWKYYRTQDGEEEVDITGKDESGYRWWSSEKEHSTHCAYMLVRAGYVVATSGRADNSITNYKHTRHCAMFLLDRALQSPTANNITTKGWSPSKFGSC